MREAPEALQRADAVVLTRTGLVGPDRLATLRYEVVGKMMVGSCLMESRHEPEAVITMATGKTHSVNSLEDRSILVVSVGRGLRARVVLIEVVAP